MELNIEEIGKFIALGGTYHSHLDEKERSYRWPDFWVVPQEAIIKQGETIKIPEKAQEVTPDSELTAIIGDGIHRADEDGAWDAVKGFTVSNDITATGDWPGWSDPDHANITGVGYKSIATFSPILTEYKSKKDLSHYQDLEVKTTVDGNECGSGSTELMAFTIPDMISFASHIVPLKENDVVALGGPGESSEQLDQARSVRCTVESIGELRNKIERV